MRVLSLLLIISSFAYSQDQKVSWSDSISWKNDSVVILHVIADIEEHWHIYGVDPSEEIGPIPTSILFAQNDSLYPRGAFMKGVPVTKFDEAFGMDLSYYENQAIFKQEFLYLGETELNYEIEFMVCDNANCLPPELISKSKRISK